MPILNNPRHEKFVLALSEGKSASEAYKLAGYHPCRQNAARLMTNDDIKRRLGELQTITAKKAEITIESICAELDQANAVAMAKGQAAAMVSASALRAKLAGLLTDRVEITASIDDEFNGCESMEDLASVFVRHYGDKGFELAPNQRIEFGQFLAKTIASIDEYVAGCCAKTVPPVDNGRDQQSIERKRLGLLR